MIWRDIREGLKLRNIVQSMRINEQGEAQFGSQMSKLIIQRKLGFKELIPQSGQWQVCADEHSECWYCGQHILTLFIWTPRISQLLQVKDAEVINYYKDAVELLT